MKKLITILSIVLLLGGIITPITIHATSSTSAGTNVILPKDETVNKDYFAAGQTVTLSGTVNGDAYIAGGNVVVDGVVNGDLLAAGGTVTIRGKVKDDVRVAGGQIIVSGEIGRNLTTVGGSVTITDSAKVNGSLTAGVGNLSIFAPIGKESTIGAGQVTIDTTMHGDVQAGVGQLAILPNAKILGNLTYWSDTSAQIDKQASISGATTHHIPPKPTREEQETARKSAVAGSVGFTIFSFLAALVIGLLLTFLIPLYMKGTATLILEKPFVTLGIGFLSMVVAPFIFILLLITVIGIPLDIILLLSFGILIYLSKIIVSVALGEKVLEYLHKDLSLRWAFFIGLVIYYILTALPILGVIVWMLGGFMGLGALILQKKYLFTAFRKKNLI